MRECHKVAYDRTEAVRKLYRNHKAPAIAKLLNWSVETIRMDILRIKAQDKRARMAAHQEQIDRIFRK
jgi:hypothetical protein